MLTSALALLLALVILVCGILMGWIANDEYHKNNQDTSVPVAQIASDANYDEVILGVVP